MTQIKILSRWSSEKVLYKATPPANIVGANQAALLGWAIKNALKSDAVLRGADLSGADLSGAVLIGANLSDAGLRGADLRGANLSYAVLIGANLRDAVLRGADLSDADLSDAVLRGALLRGADLRGAYLRGADLRDADLRGADLSGAEIPLLPNIDAAILEAVEKDGNKLDMGSWHTCQTTHCRAGWAIHLCGDAGYALEKAIGSSAAGALIYAKSRPDKLVPNFNASDEDAMADMRACAAEAAK